MIEITAPAREKVLSHLEEADRTGYWLRVEIVGRSADDFIYRLIFMPPEFKKPEDHEIESDGIHLVIDPLSARYLDGAVLEFIETSDQAGFKIDNPNPLWHDPKATAVNEIIESQINPGIAMHGGRVTLLDVQDEVAFVAMGGGCQGCGLANVTLKQGVERMIQEAVPEITQVVDTTEHSLGTSPFYKATEAGEAESDTTAGSSPLA